MVQVSFSYKNKEFVNLDDSLLNQLAERGKKMLMVLLEPVQDLLIQEKNGRIRICLDERPNIELEGFSPLAKFQIEQTLRGEYLEELYRVEV